MLENFYFINFVIAFWYHHYIKEILGSEEDIDKAFPIIDDFSNYFVNRKI
ncbi:MAG: hypothetical protein Q8N99_02315 [Nanoarchaeota archaeon]|nr:hypothetical protein [Nanoarchaeota archaeon]